MTKKIIIFFSEGFFKFKDQSFISKQTKIKIHKDVFNNDKQDPRLYGSASSGDDKKTEIKKEYLLVVAKIRNAQLGVLPLKK